MCPLTLPQVRRKAKALGEKYYFTGKQCKYGHTAKRLTSTGDCTECSTAMACRRKYHEENADHVLFLKQRWRDTNKSHVSEYNKSETARLARKRWRDQNKGHQNYLTRKRQKQVKRATPVWACQTSIKQIYVEAADRSVVEETQYHVDHIIPLQGENVCGLHVRENLQILLRRDNINKGNTFCED